MLGVPFYGRTFTLLDPALHGVGAAATNVGFQGAYTREDGFLGYNEVVAPFFVSRLRFRPRFFSVNGLWSLPRCADGLGLLKFDFPSFS